MFHELIATMGPFGAFGIIACITGVTALVVATDMAVRLHKEDKQLRKLATKFAVVANAPLSPCALLSRLLR